MKITKTIKGQVVGELTLTKNSGRYGNEWEISYIDVHPDYRNKGIATDLLNKAKDHAVKRGLVLIGFVDPKRDGGMTHEQIKAWLVKHGFKHAWVTFGNYMVGTYKKRGFEFNA